MDRDVLKKAKELERDINDKEKFISKIKNACNRANKESILAIALHGYGYRNVPLKILDFETQPILFNEIINKILEKYLYGIYIIYWSKQNS